jgi:NAD(P)-dependent dehydrogenase (short-subunit alcohol dehydrogenase family)
MIPAVFVRTVVRPIALVACLESPWWLALKVMCITARSVMLPLGQRPAQQGRDIMSVAGKVVLITGAARGLGFEYARALGAAGAHVVVGDIADCAAAAAAAGNGALGVRLDVTEMASAEAMATAAVGRFGRIDGLINNAALYGSLRGGRFNAIPEADWDAAMAVNVKGIWNCCKAVVAAMRAAGGGSIVNIASLAATYGMPYALHYTTSKAAVIGMTRGLARELGRDNIRVNAVAPSAVLTEGTQEFFGDKLDRALDTIRTGQALQRTLVPADLTGTVAWLISDESRFVTGQTIAVDGGTVML